MGVKISFNNSVIFCRSKFTIDTVRTSKMHCDLKSFNGLKHVLIWSVFVGWVGKDLEMQWVSVLTLLRASANTYCDPFLYTTSKSYSRSWSFHRAETFDYTYINCGLQSATRKCNPFDFLYDLSKIRLSNGCMLMYHKFHCIWPYIQVN